MFLEKLQIVLLVSDSWFSDIDIGFLKRYFISKHTQNSK